MVARGEVRICAECVDRFHSAMHGSKATPPSAWEILPPPYLTLLKDERLDFVPVLTREGPHGWTELHVPPGVSAAIRRWLNEAQRPDRPALSTYVRAALAPER
jgi:hypothetical protein